MDDDDRRGIDIESAVGWDPDKRIREEKLAKGIKANPRFYNPIPELIAVQPANVSLDEGIRYGKMDQLFGPLWHRDEIAVLFSPPGYGKSALAVQIAESIARDAELAPFEKPPSDEQYPPPNVLYVDFELSRQQFANRYSVARDDSQDLFERYEFAPNLSRGFHYWNGHVEDGYEDFTDMLFADLDCKVGNEAVRVVVLDNITFLTMRSHASSNVAIRLMNFIRELRDNCGASVLVVAHTPKHPEYKPITINELQGSVDIAKIADSIFVLGRSAVDRDLRYLRQIKSRSGRIEYDAENVLVYKFEKFDFAERLGNTNGTVRAKNFLGFDLVGCEPESGHLAKHWRHSHQPKKRSKRGLAKSAKKLAEKGLSSGAIAERLGIGRSTAHRYVQTEKKEVGSENGSILPT